MKLKKKDICAHCQGTGLANNFGLVWKRVGVFVPNVYTIKNIHDEFIEWSNANGLYWIEPRLDVRSPEINAGQNQYVDKWHYDGVLHPPVPETLVMWCNQDPTEIKVREDSTDIPFEPFEVLIVNNLKTVHRRRNVSQEGRWFFKIANAELLPAE